MKNAQIQDAQGLCIDCGEGITNPVCPECLAREMATWQPKVDSILPRDFDTYPAEGVRCLFCGKVMNICAHCYSRDVYDSLLAVYPEESQDFIDTFNFNLREILP